MAKKEKRKKVKKVGQTKAVDSGLEGFVDWVDPFSNEPAEEREDDMSSLVARFTTRICKWVMRTQGEITPGSEVLCDKSPKQPSPDEEV